MKNFFELVAAIAFVVYLTGTIIFGTELIFDYQKDSAEHLKSLYYFLGFSIPAICFFLSMILFGISNNTIANTLPASTYLQWTFVCLLIFLFGALSFKFDDG